MQWLVGTHALLPMMLVAASPLARRQSSTTSFSLYAYGDSIGGLPVLYSNGLAYIGERSLLNSSFQDPSFAQSSNMLIANANTMESTNATSNQYRFALPPVDSTGQASFVSNTSSSAITSGFLFYGHVVFLSTSSGSLESLFGAEPTDTEGLWKLMWNSSLADESIIPLSLKNTAPSTA